MIFNFIIGLVNSPQYTLGIIQESLDLNGNLNEHLIYSLYQDARAYYELQ